MARRKYTSAITHTGDALPPPPPIPAPKLIEDDLRKKAEIRRLLAELTEVVTQNNLDRAVRLAQMAARRQGPLVEFFQTLGLQYYKLADNGPEKPGPALRVIRGSGD
jgi:hypothetical protein